MAASPTCARFFWRTALLSNVSSPVLLIRIPARSHMAGFISRGVRGAVPDSELVPAIGREGLWPHVIDDLLTAGHTLGCGTGHRRSRADEDAASGRTAVKAGVGHRGRPVRAATTRG